MEHHLHEAIIAKWSDYIALPCPEVRSKPEPDCPLLTQAYKWADIFMTKTAGGPLQIQIVWVFLSFHACILLAKTDSLDEETWHIKSGQLRSKNAVVYLLKSDVDWIMFFQMCEKCPFQFSWISGVVQPISWNGPNFISKVCCTNQLINETRLSIDITTHYSLVETDQLKSVTEDCIIPPLTGSAHQ